MGAWRRRIAPVAACLAALVLTASGTEDFANNPRPPAPIALSARISDQEVSLSPNTAKAVGAGLATITISNQTNDPTKLLLEGPTDQSSSEIVADGHSIRNRRRRDGVQPSRRIVGVVESV